MPYPNEISSEYKSYQDNPIAISSIFLNENILKNSSSCFDFTLINSHCYLQITI